MLRAAAILDDTSNILPALVSKFIIQNSTRVGWFLYPSSGVSYCILVTVTCFTGLTTAIVQDQDGPS